MAMNQDKYLIDQDVCREVYVILTKLNLYNRLPEELREYIQGNQNINYNFDFNEKMPLYYQLSNNDTKDFLTFLFIKYINTNKKDEEYCKNAIIEVMNEQTEK